MDFALEPAEYDWLAFALVMAVHHKDNDEEGRLIWELMNDPRTLVQVLGRLTSAVDRAWIERCEADGVSFEVFAQVFGLWLAGGDV